MKWLGRRSSDNVDDRRGMGGGGLALGGGIGTVVVMIVVYLLGGNPLQYVSNTDSSPSESTPEKDQQAKFVSVVLADTEDVWDSIFTNQLHMTYEKPTLVLFAGSTESGCGYASAATGPFYCPQDKKVYIDLNFYDELKSRFNSPGDFAMAYVVAHEVGHHVQNLLGISDKIRNAQQNASEKEVNALSVKLELQADFLAGVWAYHDEKLKKAVESGDIEEALNAAHAIGDDQLQKKSQGYVVPDSFTHGTSAERMYWFKKGFDTGDITQGYELIQPQMQ